MKGIKEPFHLDDPVYDPVCLEDLILLDDVCFECWYLGFNTLVASVDPSADALVDGSVVSMDVLAVLAGSADPLVVLMSSVYPLRASVLVYPLVVWTGGSIPSVIPSVSVSIIPSVSVSVSIIPSVVPPVVVVVFVPSDVVVVPSVVIDVPSLVELVFCF
jgi:hypothetical protein